jgi:hypothetical protein
MGAAEAVKCINIVWENFYYTLIGGNSFLPAIFLGQLDRFLYPCTPYPGFLLAPASYWSLAASTTNIVGLNILFNTKTTTKANPFRATNGAVICDFSRIVYLPRLLLC